MTDNPYMQGTTPPKGSGERKLVRNHRHASGDGERRPAKSQQLREMELEEELRDPTKVQVVIPLEFEESASEKSNVRWSSVDREEAVRLSDDRLTASCLVGYRALRSTHGVSEGSWFYELEIEDVSGLISRGPGGKGHCRVGWAMDRVPYEDLEAPLGFASPENTDPGYSYAYASKFGLAFNSSRSKTYGLPYKEGDVIGCLIELPYGPARPMGDNPKVINVQGRYHCPIWLHYWLPRRPEPCPGAKMSFFLNGEPQGEAFTDLYQGVYYPAASFYYGGAARANFGPSFRHPPKGQGQAWQPMSDRGKTPQGWEGLKLDDSDSDGEEDGAEAEAEEASGDERKVVKEDWSSGEGEGGKDGGGSGRKGKKGRPKSRGRRKGGKPGKKEGGDSTGHSGPCSDAEEGGKERKEGGLDSLAGIWAGEGRKKYGGSGKKRRVREESVGREGGEEGKGAGGGPRLDVEDAKRRKKTAKQLQREEDAKKEGSAGGAGQEGGVGGVGLGGGGGAEEEDDEWAFLSPEERRMQKELLRLKG